MGYGHGHSTVFKRSGGVEPFVLQPQIEVTTDGRGQTRGGQERSVSLAESDDLCICRKGQSVPKRMNDAAPTHVRSSTRRMVAGARVLGSLAIEATARWREERSADSRRKMSGTEPAPCPSG